MPRGWMSDATITVTSLGDRGTEAVIGVCALFFHLIFTAVISLAYTSIIPFLGSPTAIGVIPKVRRFVVVGIFDSGMSEIDSTLVYMNLADAQKFFEMEGAVTHIEIRVRDVYQAEAVAKLLQQKLGFPYFAEDWSRLWPNLFSALKLEKTVYFLVLLLMVLIGADIAGAYLLTSWLSAALVPIYSWRILWLVGLPTGVLLILLNRWIPESPRFRIGWVRPSQWLKLPTTDTLSAFGAQTANETPAVPPRRVTWLPSFS